MKIIEWFKEAIKEIEDREEYHEYKYVVHLSSLSKEGFGARINTWRANRLRFKGDFIIFGNTLYPKERILDIEVYGDMPDIQGEEIIWE